MPITQRQIDQAFIDHGRTHGGVKEDYFAALYLIHTHHITEEEAFQSVAFGGTDYGVDGFLFDKDRRNFYLFQFKWSTSHELFKGSFQRLTDFGMEVIFGKDAQVQEKNDLLLRIRSSLYHNQAIIDRVIIQFVFNGNIEDAERSQVLDRLQEELEGKRYLINQYFGREVDMAIQFASAKGAVAPITTPKLHKYPLHVDNSIHEPGPNGEMMTVGFVRLVDLHQMYREMGQRFLERNIRSRLSEDEAPNRAITAALRRTLEGKQDPATFAFDHNGITLAAERLDESAGMWLLTEPRLLNGAQSVTTFDRFLNSNKGNAALADESSPLFSVRVLCRVVTEGTREFVVKVTINNNRQNPVHPWNLRANDLIQLELQDWFAKELRLYYERQERAFENLTRDDLETMDIVETKAIQLIRLTQTYLASEGEVDKMSRMTEVFENEKTYTQVFNDARTRADARHVILCYKAQFRLRRMINEILDKGIRKYGYLTRGRNMVWALLCQAILNQDQSTLERNADRFGTSLVVEADYTDWISQLVSKRVRLLIGKIVDQPPYADMVAREKYEFLRTKAFYDKCMELAYKDYRWLHKHLR